ncbi:Uncharacterized protein TCM_008454 [Theobroma cacao]|uniref:Uncharacterized protein n=1 Tax=Theobroma cacao TaxID=3641 RepID=A0A061E436_THECC|nr:Uncharacterized protein TCM_008454 [Theobroma cacao]
MVPLGLANATEKEGSSRKISPRLKSCSWVGGRGSVDCRKAVIPGTRNSCFNVLMMGIVMGSHFLYSWCFDFRFQMLCMCLLGFVLSS